MIAAFRVFSMTPGISDLNDHLSTKQPTFNRLNIILRFRGGGAFTSPDPDWRTDRFTYLPGATVRFFLSPDLGSIHDPYDTLN